MLARHLCNEPGLCEMIRPNKRWTSGMFLERALAGSSVIEAIRLAGRLT